MLPVGACNIGIVRPNVVTKSVICGGTDIAQPWLSRGPPGAQTIPELDDFAVAMCPPWQKSRSIERPLYPAHGGPEERAARRQLMSSPVYFVRMAARRVLSEPASADGITGTVTRGGMSPS